MSEFVPSKYIFFAIPRSQFGGWSSISPAAATCRVPESPLSTTSIGYYRGSCQEENDAKRRLKPQRRGDPSLDFFSAFSVPRKTEHSAAEPQFKIPDPEFRIPNSGFRKMD
jgi:hypothetical protein